MNEILTVYTTCASREEAQVIVSTLVTNRLVACATVSAIESTYVWNGKLQTEPEYAIYGKSLKNKEQDISIKLSNIHPYDTPIILFQRAQVNEDYFLWMKKQL